VSLVVGERVYAGLYFEPYVGYAVGTVDGKIGSTNIDVDSTSSVFGAKLGGTILGMVAIGGEYMAMKNNDDDKTSADDDGSSDSTFTGLFAQFSFPVLFKVSATYFLSAKYENTDNVDMEGTGTKISVGFTGLPFVAINLDMINATFDEGSSNGTKQTVDVDQSSTMLSVSLPLSL
jgi:hypothetical protein